MTEPRLRRLGAAASWLLAGLILGGCGVPAAEGVAYSSPLDLAPLVLREGQRLRAVATTSLVADAVHRVAGEAIELTLLMPPGIDPHAYEPTPQSLRAVAEAHVVFANGLGLETFLPDLLAGLEAPPPVIEASEGIVPLRAAGGEASEAAQGGADPHVWMDPANVARWVENIAASLAALDPSNAAEYAERGAAYRAELEALDAQIGRALAEIPPAERLLVTDHDELGYFAARYGFTVIGAVIPGYSTAAEPSAQEIAALEEAIRHYGARAVFISQVVTPSLVQRVAEDTGVRLVSLHVHSLTGPGGEAPDYLSLMRYNLDAIVSALRP